MFTLSSTAQPDVSPSDSLCERSAVELDAIVDDSETLGTNFSIENCAALYLRSSKLLQADQYTGPRIEGILRACREEIVRHISSDQLPSPTALSPEILLELGQAALTNPRSNQILLNRISEAFLRMPNNTAREVKVGAATLLSELLQLNCRTARVVSPRVCGQLLLQYPELARAASDEVLAQGIRRTFIKWDSPALWPEKLHVREKLVERAAKRIASTRFGDISPALVVECAESLATVGEPTPLLLNRVAAYCLSSSLSLAPDASIQIGRALTLLGYRDERFSAFLTSRVDWNWPYLEAGDQAAAYWTLAVLGRLEQVADFQTFSCLLHPSDLDNRAARNLIQGRILSADPGTYKIASVFDQSPNRRFPNTPFEKDIIEVLSIASAMSGITAPDIYPGGVVAGYRVSFFLSSQDDLVSIQLFNRESPSRQRQKRPALSELRCRVLERLGLRDVSISWNEWSSMDRDQKISLLTEVVLKK